MYVQIKTANDVSSPTIIGRFVAAKIKRTHDRTSTDFFDKLKYKIASVFIVNNSF